MYFRFTFTFIHHNAPSLSSFNCGFLLFNLFYTLYRNFYHYPEPYHSYNKDFDQKPKTTKKELQLSLPVQNGNWATNYYNNLVIESCLAFSILLFVVLVLVVVVDFIIVFYIFIGVLPVY